MMYTAAMLATAQRHVDEGTARVIRQRALIESGRAVDRKLAATSLALMLESLDLMIDHRDRIARGRGS
jgi:hypothetical protein